jgi:hypothetical protein
LTSFESIGWKGNDTAERADEGGTAVVMLSEGDLEDVFGERDGGMASGGVSKEEVVDWEKGGVWVKG